ncbi:hypothetical protein HK104_002947, partial [Borealophlyctis nickersoniae]
MTRAPVAEKSFTVLLDGVTLHHRFGITDLSQALALTAKLRRVFSLAHPPAGLYTVESCSHRRTVNLQKSSDESVWVYAERVYEAIQRDQIYSLTAGSDAVLRFRHSPHSPTWTAFLPSVDISSAKTAVRQFYGLGADVDVAIVKEVISQSTVSTTPVTDEETFKSLVQSGTVFTMKFD